MNYLESVFSSKELAALKKACFTFSKKSYGSFAEIQDRDVIVFGAGLFGQIVVDMLLREGIVPKYCIDSNPAKIGTRYRDINILSVETLQKESYPLVILTSAYAREMFEQCKKYKVETILPVDLPPSSIPAPPVGYHFDEAAGTAEIAELASLLDEQSLLVLKNFLAFQLTLDLKFIKKIYIPDPYYAPDMLSMVRYDVFCDLGASIGDTYKDFLKHTIPGKTGQYKYYAFEPDYDSFLQLQNTTKDDTNVVASFLAIAKSDGLMAISGSGIESSLLVSDRENRREVQVKSLDSFFKGKNPLPTILKADVEGYEMEVLRGADNLIRSQRPDLIFSVYHKKEDIYAIPLYIHRLNLGYSIHLRQHSETYGDTVVYAIAT
ncbi:MULTISPECIES: FkbM family methyltransferase [unclassified Desulfovibrio]|uniref:FkbM family methyltransferase n=1 Tax=unclassified Desulfovibrio TaxID=2593640 RepID=UPI002FDA0EB6